MELRQDELQSCGITVHDLPPNFQPGCDLNSLLSDAVLADGNPVLAPNAALTFGVPWLSAEVNVEWFGRRFFYWKNGVPIERLIGITMSRIGRTLERQKTVFDAIRTAVVGIDANRESILISCATASDPYISRAAKLFGRSVVRITAEHAEQSWGEFWSAVHVDSNQTDDLPNVYVSPQVSPVQNSAGSPSAPLCDRLQVGVVHRVLCPFVRGRGHTRQLIAKRLDSTAWPVGSVQVRNQNKTARQLIDLGAVGWYILGDRESPSVTASSDDDRQRPDGTADALQSESIRETEFLTHCTRRYDGPWPGESETQFLDDLLLDRDGADHSALATLCRIVAQQKLLASADVIRGNSPVVCLADCPPAELVKRRTFRSHKGKWDYEPYGICIRRDWLKDHGGRAVTYLAKSQWAGVAEADYWFHQTESTSDGSVDWTEEREWRVQGDIDLSTIPADSAYVFVPDQLSASTIQAACPWPIVILDSAVS